MDAVMDEVSFVMAIVLHIRTSAWLGWHEVSGYIIVWMDIVCIVYHTIICCSARSCLLEGGSKFFALKCLDFYSTIFPSKVYFSSRQTVIPKISTIPMVPVE
jgi:hypothetical protein